MKSPLDEAILAAHPFDMTGWRKIDEVPFDFERRRVSVLVEHDAKRRLIVKGAPEDLLRLSGQYEAADGKERPLDAETRRTFEATLDALGAQGFRALGIASRAVDVSHETAAITDESDLVFSGFAVFLDPPKASAGATIQALAAAGVAVKVLTGDNERVTRHVFAEIGVPVTGVLTGRRAEASLGRGADRAVATGQFVLPGQSAAEASRPAGAEAARPCRRLHGRRHQRCAGVACRRCRDLGRWRRRCRACGRRSDPARTRPFGRARSCGPRAQDSPERVQIRPDGLKLEFWQHVQHGGGSACSCRSCRCCRSRYC